MGIIGNIRLKVAEAFGGSALRESIEGEVSSEIQAQVRQAVDVALQESVENSIPIVDELGDSDDHLFRSVETKSQRNLTERRRERVLKIAYWLSIAYPLAKRAVEVKRDFIMGDGFTVEADDPEVQKVIDDFLNDPDNDINDRFDTWMLELSIYGELFLQAFTNKVTGAVKIGFIDPLDVRRVITDPDNAMIARAVKLKTNHGEESKVIRAVHVDNRVNEETHGRLVGEVFVFQINKASNAQRGNSDFLPVIDWIEAHEQFLFGVHEGNEMRNSVIWDVEAVGADQKKLQELRKEYGRIKKGMVRIHNEKVKVSAVTPNMASQDQTLHASLLKHHIAAGLGIPVEWLSERSKSNVGNDSITAGVPATKSLRQRQKKALGIWKRLIDYALDRAQDAGKITSEMNRSYKVVAPHIYAVDIQRIAQSLLSTAQALMVGVQNGFTDEFTAREIFTHLMGQFGIDMNNAETALLEIEGIDPEDIGDMKVGHMNALMALIDKLGEGGLTKEQAMAVLRVAFPTGRTELFKKLIDAFFGEEEKKSEPEEDDDDTPDPEKTKGIANGATGRPPAP